MLCNIINTKLNTFCSNRQYSTGAVNYYSFFKCKIKDQISPHFGLFNLKWSNNCKNAKIRKIKNGQATSIEPLEKKWSIPFIFQRRTIIRFLCFALNSQSVSHLPAPQQHIKTKWFVVGHLSNQWDVLYLFNWVVSGQNKLSKFDVLIVNSQAFCT